jgi:CHAD domain-containing protein
MTPLPDETAMSRFAAATLLKLLDALAGQADGVKEAKYPECVHRMRVASRRVRNAMGLFETVLPPRRFPKWLKRIKRVTQSLGAARDTDVQIAFLDSLLKGLAGPEARLYRPGIETVRLRLTQHRQRLQDKVTQAIDRLEGSGAIPQMQQRLRGVLAQARAVQADSDTESLRPRACQTLLQRLEQMLAFVPYVSQPDRVEELHQMRIAAKHLRYTLEVYAPVFDLDLDPYIQRARSAQSLLGHLHDFDVWLGYLPQFLEDEAQRFEAFFGHRRGFGRVERGVEYLRQECVRRREAAYQEFAAFWQQSERDGVWGELTRSLRSAVGAAGQTDDVKTEDGKP